jgi:osmotically-inducible protein OsmY
VVQNLDREQGRYRGQLRSILASRILAAIAVAIATAGCMALPRSTCSDDAFANHIQGQAEKLPIPGIYELRATAAGGHVTLGGRVDSPETLKQIVRAVATTPGLTQLSFFGVELEPADIPDDIIVANARHEAALAIGDDIVSKLGFYCEDHRLFVYGTLPSLPMREKLEETIRQVPGVGLYHVSCEIVLENPPTDAQVVAAVRRRFRRPLQLPNLTFRASQVQVTSTNNVVCLTGRAPSLAGKLAAGAQAAQIEGVRYVVNRIEVPGIRITDRAQGIVSPNGATPEEPTLSDSGNVTTIYETELDSDKTCDDRLLPPLVW